MILGIHYFITKLKTKIDVIPRGCFKYRKYMCNICKLVIDNVIMTMQKKQKILNN